MPHVQGKRETAEAVLVAVLCAVATSAVQWGYEAMRAKASAKKSKKKGGK